MGFGNFDYCTKNNFLIAPNLLGLIIWNGLDGEEITTLHSFIRLIMQYKFAKNQIPIKYY